MSRLPAAQRRQQLLDTAARLFAERGYARATTSELAKAAGVTEPIIYRHFRSKRDLFIALIERTGQETLRAWSEALADAADPAERLQRLIHSNPMVSPRGMFAYRVMLQGITEVHDQAIHAAIDRHMRAVHAFLTEEVRHAQEHRQVHRRYSAEIIAWLLMDTALGYGVLEALAIAGHGTDERGSRVAGVIQRLLLGREGRAEPPTPAES